MALMDMDTEQKVFSIAPEESLKIPTEKAEEVDAKDLTTLEAKKIAESLPGDVFSKLGEEITKRILGGTGDLEVCVGDNMIVVPKTKTILLTVHHTPYVERLLRSPWRDQVHEFEKSFLTVKVEPDKDAELRYGLGGIDEGEVPHEGDVYEGDFDQDNIDEGDTDAFTIAKTRNDPNVNSSFFKNGPQSGETRGGIEILEEGSKANSTSPEDKMFQEENQQNPFTFISEVVNPDTNLMLEVMKENSSLATEFIGPAVPAINKAIYLLNLGLDDKVYNVIDPNDITSSLLYKLPKNRSESGRRELRSNLTPLILSPSLCIFRGYKGLAEHTLVAAKAKEGWKAGFFQDYGKKNLSDRIDSWLE
jgi:ribosomal protein S6E (S10)